MTMPPPGEGWSQPEGWSQLWMTISDVFHIRGRGTVVVGRLEGNRQLNVGDTLLCEGQRWEIAGLEQFRATLTTAEPGSDIGILLAKGPAADVLRGRTVQFEPNSKNQPSLQFTPLAPKKKRWRR